MLTDISRLHVIFSKCFGWFVYLFRNTFSLIEFALNSYVIYVLVAELRKNGEMESVVWLCRQQDTHYTDSKRVHLMSKTGGAFSRFIPLL